ncbi:protein OSCP1-like [Photinus pyralis]|uniref:protein OSCP1-like n=1 Tax=Photinus pyralis TaxID=7054 RepID=UPI0012670B81|nr:protein OSCP1-like [Photinus pyralis]
MYELQQRTEKCLTDPDGMRNTLKLIISIVAVLNNIISVLISPQLIAELTKPQPPLSPEAVKSIIEDVTQSSIMRLDTNSMAKLWDLITMVFKWQVTMTTDIMALTLRHLYEIETYLINPDTHLQLHRVQNVVENFNKIFNKNEKEKLHAGIVEWLQSFNVRVSLLLRMGLQNEDASFTSNNNNAVAEDMLKNLGENIYEVTQNGKILEPDPHEEEEERLDNKELEVFANEMLGARKLSAAENGPNMNLHINEFQRKEKDDIQLKIFDNIKVSTPDDALKKIFSDLNLDDFEEDSSMKDDLLDIIGSETV